MPLKVIPCPQSQTFRLNEKKVDLSGPIPYYTSVAENGTLTAKFHRWRAWIGSRVFYGWWIVILSCLILSVGTGILYHCFTIFFLPLKRDLQVSSAAISLLYGAARLEGGVEGPLVGYLIGRLGPRMVILIGATMAGVGLILLSMVHSYWSFFFIYIFIVSLGSNAGFFHPVSAALTNWFIKRRGLVFALIAAAGAVGGMIMAPILSYIILEFGWRTGAVMAGVVILVVALPSALPISRAPELRGLYPDGRQPQKEDWGENLLKGARGAEADYTVREALRTVKYWLLATAITLRLLVTVALAVHIVPLLAWKGMAEAKCAYMVSFLALGSVVISLVIGWMGDRWNKALICSAGIVPTVGGALWLAMSDAPAAIIAFPGALAITLGTMPLNWALIGDLFGRQSYATLRGIMGVGYGSATFLSPIYAGWIHDRTGSYTIVLLTFALVLAVAASFFFALARPSPAPQRRAACE